MPNFGNWYTPDPNNYDIFQTIAYSVIDGNHVNANSWGLHGATLQKMRYRIGIPSSQASTVYTVSWDLITWDTTTGQIDVQHLSSQVTGTGTGDAFTPDQDAPAPYWDDSRSEGGGFVLTWVDNVSVSTTQSQPGSLVGSGPFSQSTLAGASGCGSCGTAATTTGIKPWGGFAAEFSMGASVLGYSAGSLTISSLLPAVSLATPAALSCVGTDAFTEVIILNNQIRQVKCCQALADIVTNSAFQYDINFYLLSQIGAKVGSTYPTNGTPPFVTWRVENPDASTNTFNRVRVTETRSGLVKVYDSTYTAATGSWKIDYPGGVREDEWTVTIVTNTSLYILGHTVPAYTRTVTVATRVPGGADQLKVKRVYQQFSWGEGLIEETLSPDTNPRTTTYIYDPNSFSQHGQALQKVIHPNGSWEWYQYGSYGRVSDIYTSRANVSSDGTSPPGNARHTIYYYGVNGDNYLAAASSGDDGTIQTNTPRCILETESTDAQYDIPISQRITAIPSADLQIDIQVADPNNATWYDPANLFTTNRYYTSGANLGRLKSIVRPDRTLQTFNYAYDSSGSYLTNMTASGQANAGFTQVIDGTTNYSVLNIAGQPLVSLTMDIVTGYTNAQSTYSNFDSFGRPGRVTYLDGTHEDTTYACCGIDTTTDRDGATTTYYYDAAKRLAAQNRLNSTTTNLLDAPGHILKTTRIGTDFSQMVLSQSSYDLAGVLVNETNALGGVTSYAESVNSGTGEHTRTTTYPDGGTRIETYYRDGSLESVTGTAVSPARYEYSVDYDSSSPDLRHRFTREIKLTASYGDTSECTTNYTDAFGRPYKTAFAAASGSPSTLSTFNALGQMTNQIDADGVITLFAYNGRGELEYTAVDVNRNNAIDSGVLDRVTHTVNDITTSYGYNVRRSQTYAYPTDNSSSALLISKTESSTDGLLTWQTVYRDATTPVLSSNRTVYAGTSRYATNIAADGSSTVSAYLNGRLASVTRKDSTGAQVTKVSYAYDTHGRQAYATDARTGTTTFTFNSADQVVSATAPALGNGQAPQTTTTSYDTSLRAWKTTQPDGTSVTNEFYPTGSLKRNYGSRTYAVGYGYDPQGRMTRMTNWTTFSTGAGERVTTWNYNQYRGWLDNKRYPDNAGPDYTYTAGGRLKTRVWARTGTGGRVTTTYTYGIDDGYSGNDYGDLLSVVYSNDPQSTPGITCTYDRRGRQKTIAQNGITTTLAIMMRMNFSAKHTAAARWAVFPLRMATISSCAAPIWPLLTLRRS